MSRKTSTVVQVGGRDVELTNLQKVMYPSVGFTKAHILDYYLRVAPVLLPHLSGRPLNLKRYPDGVEGEFFFQKECPAYRPKWLTTKRVWSETKGDDINYCLIEDEASLAWIVNTGNIEIHSFLARADRIERPTVIAFDLDPGPGADLITCCQVAVWVRERLKDWGLKCWVKVSGSKGMQAYVPVNSPTATYEQTRPLARQVAAELELEQPTLVTSNMRKALRQGKVLVDWSQNHAHKSTVAVYSLRAKAKPQVSMPLEWGEVEHALGTKEPEQLVFGPDSALARVKELGDLFEPVLKLRQRLPAVGA